MKPEKQINSTGILPHGVTIEWLPFFILLWLSLDFIVLGKFGYISTGDNGDIIIPGLISNKAMGYGSPLWHVFSTAGNDRLSQGFFGALETALFDRLPGWLAYQIRAVSQLAAAVLGTYAICRRGLELGRLASAVGGFFYANVAMSGQLVQSV